MSVTAENEPRPNRLFPFNVDNDPCEWERIPGSVKDKLRLLRRELADMRAMWRGVGDAQRTARDAKQVAELRLRAIAPSKDEAWFAQPHNSIGPLDESHAEVRACRKRIETANAELQRLAPIVTARERAIQQLGSLVEACETYLRERLSGVATITVHRGGAPRPEKKETPLDAVERCRSRISELSEARIRVASAPMHAADAKRRARQEVDALAARGAPNVGQLVAQQNGTITWQERAYREQVVAGRVVVAELDPAPLPVLAWLHRDAIIQKLEAAIDEIADDPNALTNEQRRSKLADIDAAKLAAEREEEWFVEAALASGANLLLRRASADPRAILALASEMPEPR